MNPEKEQVPVTCSLSGKVLRGKLLYLMLRYGSFFVRREVTINVIQNL